MFPNKIYQIPANPLHYPVNLCPMLRYAIKQLAGYRTMWKEVGAAKSPTIISREYSQFTPKSLTCVGSPIEVVKNDQNKRYFKSGIDKSRLDGSRLSSTQKDRFAYGTLFDSQRATKMRGAEGNNLRINSDRENRPESPQKDMTANANDLKELIQEVKRSRHSFPVKNYEKIRELKNRISDVKSDHIINRQSIRNDIQLFKDKMNLVSIEFLSRVSSKKQQNQLIETETTLSSASPKKDVQNLINRKIADYQKLMQDLEKRKQQLLKSVIRNETNQKN